MNEVGKLKKEYADVTSCKKLSEPSKFNNQSIQQSESAKFAQTSRLNKISKTSCFNSTTQATVLDARRTSSPRRELGAVGGCIRGGTWPGGGGPSAAA